jgi:hypothetical protein
LWLIACPIGASAAWRTLATSPASGSTLVQGSLGAALALSMSSFSSAMTSRIPFWATLSDSSISLSEISSEPPSTITIESAEPLTTRSSVENSSC